MPWARASALSRHLECPAASHLPILDRGTWFQGYLAKGTLVAPPGREDVFISPPEDDSSAADWGTAMHAAKANAPEAQDPWLEWVEPHRERLWPNRLGEHEVTVSWNCRTKSLELYRSDVEQARTDWKMAQPDDCVVGTCDWWAQLPSGEPWIDDLGTGWCPKDPLSAQNLFYLMCRMKTPEGAEWATGRSSICHWPRKSGEPSYPTRDGLWRQVTRLTLDAFEEELHWAWVRAVGTNPAARPGGHCMYCPSQLVCDRANE